MHVCDRLTTWLVVAAVPLLTLVALPLATHDTPQAVAPAARQETVSQPGSRSMPYPGTPYRVPESGRPVTWSL
ncbi:MULTISPECIES: hypothetical protein [unclassified Modicisalibacter]|uniref:hypothetical protein n=1 Tax=unclassified Modicisalibacter TaxID=2679913 RepID=UPI001CCC0317|nr:MULTISPECIES: hypothetical protein [unclassified Modicisalibacter]MBZ9558868.1 hypothetical protein [Modicisalibacter sp. R2A 31.J]MBZ9575240.1 hypothetical protein [Modicisalibacter sp. MOD 31.J]